MGKKYESRAKQPTTLEFFARCAKQHVALWCLFFGAQRKDERMCDLATLEKLHEAHPDLFTIEIVVADWEEMT